MNQKDFANIILIAVIVVLLGAVGYFMFVKKTTPIAQQPTPATTQTKTPAPTPNPKDETASWKTYSNNVYRFGLKYPNTWSFQNNTSSVDKQEILSVGFFGEKQSASIQVYTAKPNGKVLLASDASKKEPITIGGTNTMAYIFPNGYECYGVAPTANECFWLFTYFQKGTKWFSIDVRGKAPVDPYLILSTFKFTAAVSQVPVLKTYTDTDYGFSLVLPESWKGYTIEKSTWHGSSIDPDNPDMTTQGPEVAIKNPKGKEWQPIPIMIFTPDQWKLIEEEKINVSAAIIGPGKIGQNTKYVFALPPRWVGYVDYLGQDEAVRIAQTFKAF